MLNNRELASLILLGIIVIICVTVPGVRRSLASGVARVARALFVWPILVIFAGFLTWVSGWIALAAWAHLWEFGLLKDTMIIVVTLGFPLLFQTVTAKSGTEIFHKIRSETLSISAFLLFYVNLEPLPLWGELVLQPLAVFVQLLAITAGQRSEHRAVQRLASVTLVLIGTAMLAWSTGQIATNAGSYDLLLLAKTLGLSVWLPMVMFPYFYGVAFYATTESILRRVQRLGGEAQPFRVRLAVFLGLRFSVKRASSFNGRYDNVARAATLVAARQGMRDFRADVRRRAEAESERLADLERYADVTGVDDNGAQLDRREFNVTKERLHWIWTTQIAYYEGNWNRFWDELTDMMVSADRHGLPEDHGFVTETTKDHQKWRTWRRLPSGWILGIGGTARGDKFLYEGADPPASWPPDPQHWTDATTEHSPSDWKRSDDSCL
jgi:hypothetical protein